MRTVMRNHSEVCQVWAEQQQDCGTAGNISFEGDTIKSYHWWPMARIEGEVCLIRDERYSPSTSQHQRHVLDSVYGKYKLFHVKHIAPVNGHDEETHKINLCHYADRLRAIAKVFWGARKRLDSLMSRYQSVVAEAKEYCTYYECGQYMPPSFGLELKGELARKKMETASTK